MRHFPAKLVGAAALAFLAAVMGGGCAVSPYQDVVHPEFSRFGVRRVGVVVWCSRYSSEELAAISLDPLDPATTTMDRVDQWDKALTPAITAQIQTRLKEMGYEALDEGSSVTFGPQTRTRDAIAAIRRDHPELDSVLLVSYTISQFHTSSVPLSEEPGGGVAVSNTSTYEHQGRYTYSSQSDQWQSNYYTQIGHVNLRGSVKLILLASGQVLYEIGESRPYIAYASSASRAADDAGGTAVCRVFGSEFTRPTAHRHGLPPRANYSN